MTEKAPSGRSWWTTLPGVLTAIAALITATTGLLAAADKAGLLRTAPPSVGPPAASERRDQVPAPAQPPADTSGHRPLANSLPSAPDRPTQPSSAASAEAPDRAETVRGVQRPAAVAPELAGRTDTSIIPMLVRRIDEDRVAVRYRVTNLGRSARIFVPAGQVRAIGAGVARAPLDSRPSFATVEPNDSVVFESRLPVGSGRIALRIQDADGRTVFEQELDAPGTSSWTPPRTLCLGRLRWSRWEIGGALGPDTNGIECLVAG